jgi:hypothetical protein
MVLINNNIVLSKLDRLEMKQTYAKKNRDKTKVKKIRKNKKRKRQ